MLFKKKTSHFFLAPALVVIFLLFGAFSPAFPLRELEPGSHVPDLTLPSLAGGEANVLRAENKIMVILFWGTDSEGKEERSISLLHLLQTISTDYGDNGVIVSSVNVDKNNQDHLRKLIEREGITVPVLLDTNEELYGEYGLFVLPTIAIVNRDGTLKTAVGYTHNIRDIVTGRVQVMLGMKTEQDLEDELHPEEMVEIPDNVRKAQNHLNLGRRFQEKGMTDLAATEFEKAVNLDPENSEAHIELGSSYLHRSEYDKAQAELAKATEIAPDSIHARFSTGVLYRKMGEYDKAISELERVIKTDPSHARAFRELGAAFEAKGDVAKALSHYREALSIVFENK